MRIILVKVYFFTLYSSLNSTNGYQSDYQVQGQLHHPTNKAKVEMFQCLDTTLFFIHLHARDHDTLLHDTWYWHCTPYKYSNTVATTFYQIRLAAVGRPPSHTVFYSYLRRWRRRYVNCGWYQISDIVTACTVVLSQYQSRDYLTDDRMSVHNPA